MLCLNFEIINFVTYAVKTFYVLILKLWTLLPELDTHFFGPSRWCFRTPVRNLSCWRFSSLFWALNFALLDSRSHANSFSRSYFGALVFLSHSWIPFKLLVSFCAHAHKTHIQHTQWWALTRWKHRIIFKAMIFLMKSIRLITFCKIMSDD